MTDYTKLTENEKQVIVVEYKKKYNKAIAVEVAAVLMVGIVFFINTKLVLNREVFNVMLAIAFIIFGIGEAVRVSLLKCPVCGGNLKNNPLKRTHGYPVRCPHCGVFLGDKIDAINEHINNNQ